jgi:hypothetical protein
MHLGAGESGALPLVFTAKPRACATPGDGTTFQSSRDVTIRLSVAGVVDNTQVVPLAPDQALAMRHPTRADCRR